MKTRRARRAAVDAAAQEGSAQPENALSEAVVASILQHVPLQHRLRKCALVGKLWAAAAVAATTDIVLTRVRSLGCLTLWLQKHGAHVKSIKLLFEDSEPWYDTSVLAVPCAKLPSLQRLVVHWAKQVHLQLDLPAGAAALPAGARQSARTSQRSGSSSQQRVHRSAATAAPALALPRLQELDLLECALSPSSVQVLPLVAASMTRLKLDTLDEDGVSTHVPQLLQHLPALQDLSLACLGVPDRGYDAVSTLKQLRQLSLVVLFDQDCSIYGKLPAILTALTLWGDTATQRQKDEAVWVDMRNVPLLQGLTGLQRLKIKDVLIQPSRLTTLDTSVLTHLELDNVVPKPETEGRKLLQHLPRLTGLQHLQLGNNFYGPPLPPQLFSTLAALSGLTSLRMDDDAYQPLPKGALQHILPAGKQLPHLAALHINCGKSEPSAHAAEVSQGQFWCLDTADISRIADCCPGMRALGLRHVVRDSADVSSLIRLGPLLDYNVAGKAFQARHRFAAATPSSSSESSDSDSSGTE